MLELGKPAPDFKDLLATDGKKYSLHSFDSKPILVVIFSCNHCPYVQAYESRIIGIQADYGPKGVQIIAINSNDDQTYPEDSYDKMVKRARKLGFNFVYARDADQKAVDTYGAVCTPHIFAFDKERKLRYRGRIDDSKEPAKVTTHDLRNALDDLLAGRQVKVADTRPFGCSIKWMEGTKTSA
jgi:thiol-disulfide isomerase/thioredoxin